MGKTRPVIAVLGPKGTHTERVAKHYWQKRQVTIKRLSSIPAIFEYVNKGKARYGIIPVEDSVEGDVPLSFDFLRNYDLYVVRELHTKLTHCLLAKKGEKEIKTIASHPQALAHCRRYLERFFPNIELKETPSTAEAARLASTDSTIGAIADEKTADIYGLNVISKEVHDFGYNTTRFLVIARKSVKPKGPAKTSIIIDIPKDRPGILHQLLGEFSKRKINLTKIMSRPSRRMLGEYVFFIDFECNEKDPKVKAAYRAIERVAAIKSLGSYPLPIEIESKIEKMESQVTMEDLRLMEPSFKFWENEEDQVYDSY